jgi:aspartyl protease family protein
MLLPCRRSLLLGGLSAVMLTAGPRLGFAVSYAVKAGDGGHFYVTAAIENTNVDAVIDTGASAVVLPYAAAERINLFVRDTDFTVPVSTANGSTKAAAVTLRRVDIGTVRVRDVEALVMPEGVLEITLIGMSFLNRLKGFRVDDGVLVLDN